MALSTYLLYLAAVALLILTPGPTMLMCVTTAVNHGPRKALLVSFALDEVVNTSHNRVVPSYSPASRYRPASDFTSPV